MPVLTLAQLAIIRLMVQLSGVCGGDGMVLNASSPTHYEYHFFLFFTTTRDIKKSAVGAQTTSSNKNEELNRNSTK